MKQFNSKLFIVFSILLAGLAYESYIQAVAIDEGFTGRSLFRTLFGDLFNIMRFPTHVILKRWSMNPLNFAIGLIINCIIYSLIIERTIYFIFRPKTEE